VADPDKVSAVLIVKNEAKVVGRCIKSLKGLDEVLVLDTGSTDGSQEICRKLGAKVFHGKMKEPFHFANARNAALERAKYDWVLTIDADEVLKKGSVEAIRQAVNTPWNSAYSGTHLNYPPDAKKKDEWKSPPLSTTRLLLFQKKCWVWRFRIHEKLFSKTPKPRTAKAAGLVVEHRPKGSRQARRNQNLELLKLSRKEEPEHTFTLLQLGLEYILQEAWGHAIEPLTEYINTGKCEGFLGLAAAQMHLARALARSGDLQSAMNTFVAARGNTPGRREPLYWAAVELIHAGMLPDAAQWLEDALKMPPRHTPSFLLYSAAVQGTLIEDTLRECRRMMKKAESKRVS